MEPIGAQLKAAREQKQVTITKVAADTRISARHLENLEAGRYEALPGGVYNRAFLRAYCEYLGLDAQAMLERYRAETSPPVEKPAKTRPSLAEPRFRVHPVAVWSAMLLISIAGLYAARGWISDVFTPYFAPTPIPAPSPVVKSEPPAPSKPPASIEPQAGGETPDAGALVTQQQAAEGQPAGGQAPAADTSVPPPPPGTKIRLQFQVTQRCWVSVTSDGNRVLVKLLEPGDAQTFDAAESFYLILGNAGGVRATINGKSAKPFGKDGAVVKVLINEQTLEGLLETPSG